MESEGFLTYGMTYTTPKKKTSNVCMYIYPHIFRLVKKHKCLQLQSVTETIFRQISVAKQDSRNQLDPTYSSYQNIG